MGLGDVLGKAIDPLGVKKKIRRKTLPSKWNEKIDSAMEFEKFHFNKLGDMIKEDPERALLGGLTPLGTYVANKGFGADWEPWTNWLGGPTEATWREAAEAGIDIEPAQIGHQIAAAVASWYAGGALGAYAAGLGGGAGAAGGTAAGAGSGLATKGAMQAAARAAIPAAAGYMDEQVAEDFPYQDPRALMPMRTVRGLTAGLPGMAEGGHMNYARGGDIDPQEMMVGMQNIAGVPGGREVFFSVLADELRGGKKAPKQVRLFNMGGRTGYQGGGLTNAAEMTRQAGRGDDDVLLHLSPEEFEAIEAMWGKAPINPRTGIPEYGFLSDLWKGVKKVVKKIVKSPVFQFLAPIALNTFFPGAGAALGKALGMGAGQLGAHVGNALIRGGIGAAGGGKEGALSGIVSSLTMPGGQTAGGEDIISAGSQIGSKLGLEGGAAQIAGDAIIGGVGGEIGGGGFAQGAMGNVMNRMMMEPVQDMTGEMMQTIFDPKTTGIGGGEQIFGEGMSPIPAEAQAPDIFGGVGGGPEMTGAMSPVPAGSVPTQLTDLPRSTSAPWWQDAGNWIKENPLAAAAGASFLYSGLGGGGDQYGDRPPDIPSNLLEGIPEYTFDRTRNPIPSGLYYTYGVAGGPSEGEFDFFSGNVAGTPPGEGGPPGPGGPGRRPPRPRGGGPLPGLGGNRGRGGPRGGGGRRQRRPAGGRRALPQYDDYYAEGASYLPGLEPGAPQYTDDQIAFLNWNLPESSGSPYVRMMIEAQRKARERAGWNMAHGGLAQYARGGYTDMPQKPYSMQMQMRHATGGYAGRNYPRQGFAGAGYARGAGSGRDDTIEALLSDGEYVMDAETVAMLGDGSNDEGARRLDEMREELRRHKGKNLSKGKFSHDAKRPMQYLKKGGGVGKTQVKKIAKRVARDEMEDHVREPGPRGHGVGSRGAGRLKKRYKKGGRVKNPLYEARLARIAAEKGEK